jgi:hypothetical protein
MNIIAVIGIVVTLLTAIRVVVQLRRQAPSPLLARLERRKDDTVLQPAPSA